MRGIGRAQTDIDGLALTEAAGVRGVNTAINGILTATDTDKRFRVDTTDGNIIGDKFGRQWHIILTHKGKGIGGGIRGDGGRLETTGHATEGDDGFRGRGVID